MLLPQYCVTGPRWVKPSGAGAIRTQGTNFVITVPADALAPESARASAGTVMSIKWDMMLSKLPWLLMNFSVYLLISYPHWKWLMGSHETMLTWRVNTLWPGGTIWWKRTGSTLAEVMAWCHQATSHYLNQCWLIISKVLWHSPEGNFTWNVQIICPWYALENYLCKLRQNACHFADNISKCIFLNENVWILLKIPLMVVCKVRINSISALVQMIAWHSPGDKPLFETMIVYRRIHASLRFNELKLQPHLSGTKELNANYVGVEWECYFIWW